MSSPKVFVARLAGMPVVGPDGDEIGRIKDVVITQRRDRLAPRVLGLVVELPTRRRIFVPILRVAAVAPSGVTLVSGTINLHKFSVRPSERLVLGELVDSLVGVVDEDGRREDGEARIADVEIEQGRTRDWIVGRVALQPRRKSRLGRRGAVRLVEWPRIRGDVAEPADNEGADAAHLLAEFEQMRPADVARSLRELPEHRRLAVAHGLDDERLADVLQELPHDEATEIVTHLERARAADVLEVMDHDDAADLLTELSDSEAEEFLRLMGPAESGSVRRLMQFDPDTAGGVMTPEPIVLDPQTTVAEALAHCRNPDLSPAIASLVFVVRPPTATPTGRYLGSVHIQALLREPPATMVAELLDDSLSRLDPDDSVEAMTRYFATYNLVCGPVVDDEGHLLGAVSVDDLLDNMLPENWRDMDIHDGDLDSAPTGGAGAGGAGANGTGANGTGAGGAGAGRPLRWGRAAATPTGGAANTATPGDHDHRTTS